MYICIRSRVSSAPVSFMFSSRDFFKCPIHDEQYFVMLLSESCKVKRILILFDYFCLIGTHVLLTVLMKAHGQSRGLIGIGVWFAWKRFVDKKFRLKHVSLIRILNLIILILNCKLEFIQACQRILRFLATFNLFRVLYLMN